MINTQHDTLVICLNAGIWVALSIILLIPARVPIEGYTKSYITFNIEDTDLPNEKKKEIGGGIADGDDRTVSSLQLAFIPLVDYKFTKKKEHIVINSNMSYSTMINLVWNI